MPYDVSLVLPTQYADALQKYVHLIREAEELGYFGVWMTEVSGAESMALLGAASQVTDRLHLGCGVVSVYTRTMPLLAMGAYTLDALSMHRFRLGVGASTANIAERWHGVQYRHPALRVRESILLLRQLLDGQKTRFSGTTIVSDGFQLSGTGSIPPPIYVAALGADMLAVAGELADGVIITLSSRESIAKAMSIVDEAARKAGRSPHDIRRVAYVRTCLTGDAAAAISWMQRELGWYASAKSYERHFRQMGYGAEMDGANAAWAAKDHQKAFDSISPRMARELAVIGNATEVVAQLNYLATVGLDELAIYAFQPTLGLDHLRRQIAAIADTFAVAL